MLRFNINEWFEEAYSKKKYKTGYDIHINEIYPYIKKKDWIKKSLKCFDYFVKVKAQKCPEMTLDLVIGINFFNERFLTNFNNIADLPKGMLHRDSPSYYLYDSEMKEIVLGECKKIEYFIDLPINSSLFFEEREFENDKILLLRLIND